MRRLRIPEPFDHPEFIFEPKIDGFRTLAYIDGPKRRISRNATLTSTRQPAYTVLGGDRMNQFGQQRPLSPVETWDVFVDELDRRGQNGDAADVLIPLALEPGLSEEKRFADLTRPEIDALAQLGGRLGRRGDVVKSIWTDVQRTLKAQARAKSQSG